MTLKLVASTFTALALSTSLHPVLAAGKDGVKITKEKGELRVEINGELFTEYHYDNEGTASRPYFYPVQAFGGLGLTRNYPMKDVPDEEHDHKHHRGLWYGHRMVNGYTFWDETGKEGKIVHQSFPEVKSGRDVGIFKEKNKWVAPDGKEVCTDERTIRIYNTKEGRMLDFDITLSAPFGDVTFGDDKDGSMSTRLPDSMRLEHRRQKGEKQAKPGEGHIVLSTGIRDDAASVAAAKAAKKGTDTWGKRADWCDYYGPVDGKTVGVAIFDHPDNPRHPTWWHVREYGLFAANPFGQHNFEKLADKDAGNMVIPKGKSVTFRYRFYWHAGDEKQGKVAEQYEKYVASSGKRSSK